MLWCLVGVVVLLAIGAGWLGVRGALAYSHLEKARSAAAGATTAISDPAAAAELIARVSRETAAARSLTSDPVWQSAEGLPWIGPQLNAVATVAGAADDVAGSALAPLVQVASSFSLDSLRPVDGRFDTAALAQLREPAEASAERLRRASGDVSGIRTDALIGPLRAPIAEVQTLFADVARGADALQRATRLMPTMLGADGPRNYLVLFQNNAEWRSLGGIPGALAVIHAEDGRISLAAQADSGDFRFESDSLSPLPPELENLYGGQPTRYIQNVTQVPDFTVGAPIAREMWRSVFGVEVDGVIAVDPVTLSYLLAATGPITLPTGDVLSEQTAVPLLLNEVYQRYAQPRDQDAFFAAATAAVFGTLSSGGADPAKLVEALARAGDEHRLYIWNADPDAQAALDGTTLQGTLPSSDDRTTRFGVFVNDGTGSKMDYYMDVATAIGWCPSGTEAELTVRLRSDAPADAASLPGYITGNGSFGVPPGQTQTIAYLVLPPGADVVTSETAGGTSTGFGGGGMHGEHRVLTWASRLGPGEEATATIRVRTTATPELQAVVTPGVRPSGTLELAPACSATGE
jgi:hypothetical protein